MAIKVSRDGVVTSDGVQIGKVVKHPARTVFSAVSGLESSTSEWDALDNDGGLLRANCRTRREAVSLVTKAAEPLKVESVQTKEVWGGRTCVTATVSWKGYTAMVSRYPEEEHWIVDAFFQPGSSMPSWSNGTGSRVTTAHVLQGEQEEAANYAAQRAGLL